MELRRPGLEDKEAVIDLILEFERSNAAHDGGFWDKENFVYEDWIAGNQDAEMGLNIPNTWVPAIQFVAFDKGQAVGFLNLRLRLNEHLRGHGGHIGYGIRPSERGKGYGKQQLALALLEAKKLALSPVLITCDMDNAASRAVILANGGVLEDVRAGKERYWIDLG